eukprot:s1591_g24.t1
MEPNSNSLAAQSAHTYFHTYATSAKRLSGLSCPCVSTRGFDLTFARRPDHRAAETHNGRGVRALVIGDVLRRLVGCALAQAFAPQFERTCLPHQFGLSTRAGTEALARVLRAATEIDPRATMLSVDAVGAFDHVSREAMLGALLCHLDLRPLVPFARQFYGTPSSYTWTESEGGEQEDPLMPALYALAQQPALCEVQAQLCDGEAIFAFLDDTYVVDPRTIHIVKRAELSGRTAGADMPVGSGERSAARRCAEHAADETPQHVPDCKCTDPAVWLAKCDEPRDTDAMKRRRRDFRIEQQQQ